MITAITILGQLLRAASFKIDAAQILKHQADRLGKSLGIQAFFDRDPPPIERIHGLVKIVFIKIFRALLQACAVAAYFRKRGTG